MNITEEGNQVGKEESLAELEARLSLLNKSIDKLSMERAFLTNKIKQLKSKRNDKSK